jgi:DNA-directed RNA polymerase subunit RPC12/RpoP
MAKQLPDAPENEEGRECPWCGSRDTSFFKRGLTGPTDERDQYITCNRCGRLTYEIVSRTGRDMRVGQFRAGGTFRDNSRQTKYTINRVLKVGLNEFLLYLKPVIPTNDDPR